MEGAASDAIGRASTDVIAVMDQRGMISFPVTITIGADAAAAAGPVGPDARADTELSCMPRFFLFTVAGAFADSPAGRTCGPIG